MKAYSYDSEGFLIGEIQMQLDPLETQLKKREIYLTPASSTRAIPPAAPEGQRAKFDGEFWVLEDIPVIEEAIEPENEEESDV